MKKNLLLGLLALGGFAANAQIANGTEAPDFTATDVNGVVHHLYDYLDAGKTVILDISATWCGPCWGYHQSGALADLYNSYGPAGSDEVVVLFVEGDNATTHADLQGTGNNTQGDWLSHSPYPVIDDGSISNLYNLAHFPTVLRICPDRIMHEINALPPAQLKTSINTGCGVQLQGAANHGKIDHSIVDVRACEEGQTALVRGNLKNYGNNAITNATFVLKENGTVVATTNYTGNLAQFATGNADFEGVIVNSESDFTMEMTAINGAAPANPDFAAAPLDVFVANPAQNNRVEVRIHTDNYPGEASWEIRNSAGTIVASGGPYQAGPAGDGAGGPDALTVKSHWVILPGNTPECFDVILKDAYGDGWGYTPPNNPAGVEVYSSGEMVLQKFSDAAFGDNGENGPALLNQNAFRAMGVLGTETVATNTFAMYPNPTTGILNFSTQEPVDVTILDLTGKVVFTTKGVENNGSVNLSSLQSGMYIAKIKGLSSEKVEKIIIE